MCELKNPHEFGRRCRAIMQGDITYAQFIERAFAAARELGMNPLPGWRDLTFSGLYARHVNAITPKAT